VFVASRAYLQDTGRMIDDWGGRQVCWLRGGSAAAASVMAPPSSSWYSRFNFQLRSCGERALDADAVSIRSALVVRVVGATYLAGGGRAVVPSGDSRDETRQHKLGRTCPAYLVRRSRLDQSTGQI